MSDTRLVLVTGLTRQATGWVANRLLGEEPGTVLVHHDLSALAEGIVRRHVRWGAADAGRPGRDGPQPEGLGVRTTDMGAAQGTELAPAGGHGTPRTGGDSFRSQEMGVEPAGRDAACLDGVGAKRAGERRSGLEGAGDEPDARDSARSGGLGVGQAGGSRPGLEGAGDEPDGGDSARSGGLGVGQAGGSRPGLEGVGGGRLGRVAPGEVGWPGGGGGDSVAVLELRHGCVSCTLREDALPLLRWLTALPGVRRVVLQLDPGMEPEPVCWALRNALVGGVAIADLASVEAVVAVVDEGDWLAAATGDEPLGLTPDDDRTVAQVAVGQVEFADAIVLVGRAEDGWGTARTAAVLDRLAPLAPRAASVGGLLARLPSNARRGVESDAHDPLLRGCPPLEPDCGVALTVFEARRPFHPARLHRAIDVLLTGVVRARGRVWVATQPDVALWVESAGGGLQVGHAGAWLAAVDGAAWQRVSAERRVKAALEWHPRWGDRAQEIAILSHDASPGYVHATLREALLTDNELAADWDRLDDPFLGWESLEGKA